MDQQHADGDPLHAGDLVGGYRIVERIGQGGMGDVFRAWDDRLHRHVAIKAPRAAATFDEVTRRRFLRETRVACRVNHPFVATVYDVIEERSQPFLVMEFIEGTGLDELLRSDRPATDVITRYATEIAEALVAIHAEGIVHRDLKPANVMVTRAGHVKVMDFGVALPPASDSLGGDVEATLTHEGHAVGTINYMSPEQVAGRRPDPRSDLFALGIMLYEAITGDHPFRRESPLAIASAIVSDAPGGGTEPQTLTKSGPMRHVVMKLLAKDPDARYDSAVALVADLRAVAAGDELPSLRGAGVRARPRWIVPSVVAVVAVALLWGIWSVTPKPRFSPPGILVLPFDGAAVDASAEPRGAMLASLLRADLASIPSIRVVGSTRTDDLVAQWAASGDDRRKGKGLVELSAVRYLVSGRYDTENAAIRLVVDVYDADAPDRPIDFVVEATSLRALSERLLAGFRSRVPSLRVAERSAATGAETLASFSDAALLSAERGRQAADHGDLRAAAQEYDAAIRDDPNFVLAHLERAHVLYDAGYVTRAQESVDAAAAVVAKRTNPLPERLALRLAAVRAEVAENREAEIDARRRLAAATPSDPDAWADLAGALTRANRPAESLEALDQAVQHRPKDASLLLDRASRLRLLGRADAARAALDSAKRLGPNPPQGRWAARILRETGLQERAANHFPAAREAFEAACGILARTGDPHLLAATTRSLAETILREGKPAQAVPLFERASETLGEAGNLRVQASVLDQLGSSLFQLGRYEEAEANLRQAILLSEKTQGLTPNPNPFLNLASLLSYTGRFDEAAALAAKASEIATRQGDTKRVASALLQEGVALSCQGRFEAAIAAYDGAIRASGSNAPDERVGWASSGLAEVRALRGEIGAALESAGRSVAVQRDTKQQINVAYALVGRARIRRIAGDRAGAVADITEARSTVGSGAIPPDLAARIDLDSGLAALDDGELAAAESKLRAASLAPAAADLTGYARAGLAQTLCRAGRTEMGIDAARTAGKTPATFSERLAASIALASCLTLAGREREGRAEALRTAEDAERAGARWVLIEASPMLTASERSRKALADVTATVPAANRDAFLATPVVKHAMERLSPPEGQRRTR